jgi:hypothetical protein
MGREEGDLSGSDPAFIAYLEEHAVDTERGRECTITAGTEVPDVGTWKVDQTYWESPSGWVAGFHPPRRDQ